VIRRYVRAGEMIARGYGIAWRCYNSDRSVCFPLGLNLALAFLHDLWLDTTTPKSLRDDMWGVGDHYAAFRRGIEAGRQLERRAR
jgi:hypothetical protein